MCLCSASFPRSAKKLEEHMSQLDKFHDQAADLKAYFDGRGEMTLECLVRTGRVADSDLCSCSGRVV